MYYLLNPQGKTKKKASKKARKARSSSRRGTGTKKSPRRRKNPTSKRKTSMATKRKKKTRRKATKRRVVRRRKTPVRRKKAVRRKARRNPVKRRKPARRKAVRKVARKKRRVYRKKRKVAKRTARKTYRRKRATARRKKRAYKRNPKMKLGNFLPNMKELPDVLKTGAMVMGGWAATSMAASAISGPIVEPMFAALNLTGAKDESGKFTSHVDFWVWQGIDTVLAFSIAGIAGMVAGPKVRNAFLLGGMMRVVYHVGNHYLPEKASRMMLADGPGLRDWVTSADVGALPSPAVGDYITRSSMPVGSFAY